MNAELEQTLPICHHAAYQVSILQGQRSDLRRALELPDLHLDAYRLVGLFTGNGRLRLGGDPTSRQPLTAPALLLIPPVSVGALSLPPASQWEEIHFDVAPVQRRPRFHGRGPTLVHMRRAAQPAPVTVWGMHPPVLVPDAAARTGLEVLRFANQHWWRGPWQRLRADARLQAWLADWFSELAGEGAYRSDAPSACVDPWLLRVHEVAMEGLSAGIRVADLARSLGMSRQHLRRRLLELTGQGPHAFLEQLRLAHARHQLDDGLPTDAVLQAIGLRSRSAFFAAYRRRYGVTPGQHRRWS